jgi:hypothetical protein
VTGDQGLEGLIVLMVDKSSEKFRISARVGSQRDAAGRNHPIDPDRGHGPS